MPKPEGVSIGEPGDGSDEPVTLSSLVAEAALMEAEGAECGDADPECGAPDAQAAATVPSGPGALPESSQPSRGGPQGPKWDYFEQILRRSASGSSTDTGLLQAEVDPTDQDSAEGRVAAEAESTDEGVTLTLAQTRQAREDLMAASQSSDPAEAVLNVCRSWGFEDPLEIIQHVQATGPVAEAQRTDVTSPAEAGASGGAPAHPEDGGSEELSSGAPSSQSTVGRCTLALAAIETCASKISSELGGLIHGLESVTNSGTEDPGDSGALDGAEAHPARHDRTPSGETDDATSCSSESEEAPPACRSLLEGLMNPGLGCEPAPGTDTDDSDPALAEAASERPAGPHGDFLRRRERLQHRFAPVAAEAPEVTPTPVGGGSTMAAAATESEAEASDGGAGAPADLSTAEGIQKMCGAPSFFQCRHCGVHAMWPGSRGWRRTCKGCHRAVCNSTACWDYKANCCVACAPLREDLPCASALHADSQRQWSSGHGTVATYHGGIQAGGSPVATPGQGHGSAAEAPAPPVGPPPNVAPPGMPPLPPAAPSLSPGASARGTPPGASATTPAAARTAPAHMCRHCGARLPRRGSAPAAAATAPSVAVRVAGTWCQSAVLRARLHGRPLPRAGPSWRG